MTHGKILTRLLLFLVGAIGLIILTRMLLSNGAVPPLSQFIASSTPAQDSSMKVKDSETGATSTIQISSTTQDHSSSSTFHLPPSTFTVSIQAPHGTIHAEVATTDAAQQQGLSYRTDMPADHGMLFSFLNPGLYGFWMKDMNFPLDMVWIDENRMIVDVATDISPDTYPKVFFPPSDISYVLEVNAGAAQRLGLTKGIQMGFSVTTSTKN